MVIERDYIGDSADEGGKKPRLKDDERSAFGLGWEARRVFRAILLNPFPERSWRWHAFRDGWRAFKPIAAMDEGKGPGKDAGKGPAAK